MDGLEACLRSLETQTLERSLFEIIVVDNGSIFRPDAEAFKHRGIRLLYESEPGPGPARNRGVRNAAGNFLFFIDADCRAHPEWLAVALRTLASSQENTILGGDVQIWRDNLQRYTMIEAYESIFAYRQKMQIERFGFSGSGNLAVRRVDFEKIGPFGGILIAEDKEWGNRARAAGFTFKYVQQMIVFTPARPSIKQLCVQWDRLIQQALTTAQEHKYWRIFWTARAFAVCISPFVDVIEIVRSNQIVGMSARFKALAMLVVIRLYRAWRMVTLLRSSNKGVLWNRDVEVGIVDPE